MAHEDEPSVIERWVEVATAEHVRLLARLDALVADHALDVAAPSNLPDWTVGHVITHVTHSGDGHVRMLDAAAIGEFGVQYPGGMEQRVSEIEAGASRPASEQVDDLRRSIDALEQRWATMPTWAGEGRTPKADVAIADLPFLRIREVAIHHADLGLGYSFADLPEPYLDEELQRMEAMWLARHSSTASLPQAALALPPPDRLAWLLGRSVVDGIAAADIY